MADHACPLSLPRCESRAHPTLQPRWVHLWPKVLNPTCKNKVPPPSSNSRAQLLLHRIMGTACWQCATGWGILMSMRRGAGELRGAFKRRSDAQPWLLGSRRRSCGGTVERGASVAMHRGGGRDCVNDENFECGGGRGGQTTNRHGACIRASKGMYNQQTARHL
jgi:hypothetical protein